ncbi:MAG: rhodanese-like domain-containing protein [Chitinophagales bacterium]|nr:rhodanese-like domain-containing protein [Bacteroidota bacterium]MBX7141172.1 rhodanese-like domain-containing protein [Chitinophagales bacterium]
MKEISVHELKERLDKGERLIVIDVREEWEHQEFNIGAINIPLSIFMTKLEELSEYRDEEVIVHCKMGGRSLQAGLILEQMGFHNVKNVVGGMEEWKRIHHSR